MDSYKTSLLLTFGDRFHRHDTHTDSVLCVPLSGVATSDNNKDVPNFAAVSAPLSDLVRKGQSNIVNWGDSQERAYNSLKVAVTSKSVLQLPDVNKRFVLRTDASDRGLGAALMQENEDTLFPVAYACKKLTDREREYSVTEREAFAIVWGVKKFSLYLYGTVFTLETDHGALQFLNTAKMIVLE
ncbi:Pol polyprotein [Plakobranchus ocellatus]|uniref:Pol polyprotein n=1 Tax=Plakobranchus ocellatus TaxID=259542 RepID=A0AAV3YAA4_9GAST|nr:Pol polyprotein [Plakobranchus ocellatus]